MAKGDSKFKVGDIVQLKSGSPDMTVVGYNHEGHPWTTWFSGKKNEKAYFPDDALIPAPENKDEK